MRKIQAKMRYTSKGPNMKYSSSSEFSQRIYYCIFAEIRGKKYRNPVDVLAISSNSEYRRSVLCDIVLVFMRKHSQNSCIVTRIYFDCISVLWSKYSQIYFYSTSGFVISWLQISEYEYWRETSSFTSGNFEFHLR